MRVDCLWHRAENFLKKFESRRRDLGDEYRNAFEMSIIKHRGKTLIQKGIGSVMGICVMDYLNVA